MVLCSFFFGSRFPSKVANARKGALVVIWLMGYQVRVWNGGKAWRNVLGVHSASWECPDAPLQGGTFNLDGLLRTTCAPILCEFFA